MPDENRPASSAPANPTSAAGNAAASSAGAAQAAPAPGAAAKPRRGALRRVLLVAGPVVVAVGAAYAYVATGRYESTDNAYVKADIGVVSPQVAGPIAAVAVRENQPVEAGDVLFTIDDTPFRVKLAQADAQLGALHDYVEGIRASYRQKLEEIALDRENAAYEKREYERLSALAQRKLASDVDVAEARHKSDTAAQQLRVDEQELEQIRARLGGDPDQPLTELSTYLAAKSMRDVASLDLEHTVVRAPFAGVASKVPMPGQYVAPGTAVMTVVANRKVWVEANYKETDLTHVEVGQPVTVRLDTYPDHEWRGKVESISQATGAEFSVIPPQNATGNWVKITQRIPVRIAVDPRPGDPEMRVGMSAEVEIDTGYERPAPAFLTWLRPDRAEAATADGGRRRR